MCNVKNFLPLALVVFTIIFETIHSQNVFAVRPVGVKINRFNYCPKSVNEIKLNVTMRKLTRRVTGFDVSVYFPYDIGANILSKLKIARWADGGWKHNVLNFEYNDLCDMLNKVLGPIWFMVQEMLIPPMEPGKCPLKKGTYRVANVIVDWKKLSFKIPFVGRFLVTVADYRNTSLMIFCYETEAEITHDY